MKPRDFCSTLSLVLFDSELDSEATTTGILAGGRIDLLGLSDMIDGRMEGGR